MKKLVISIAVVSAFGFLSSSCSKKAETKSETTTPAVAGVQYTCPMHPEVVSDAPGSCPKCGMDLVKKEIDTPMDTTMKMGSDSAMKM